MTIALISHPSCLLHNPGSAHPESSKRLEAILSALKNADLEASQLVFEESNLVSRQDLERVHSKEYIETLFQIAPKQGFVQLDPDTVMNPFTLEAACYAAGAVVKAVDLVQSQQVNAVFCNIRPPGHHAETNKAMGFCFFNNVAIGVAYALEHYQLKRIAIIDFDVHEGNGTEEIFLNNKKVLICSSYEEGLYPNRKLKASNIIDIPLPAGASGREFREAYNQFAFAPIEKFKPELIFFSAGFDGHKLDLIADLNLIEADYYWLTQRIKQIADKYSKGKMISVLEGGYCLEALGSSVLAHIKGLD